MEGHIVLHLSDSLLCLMQQINGECLISQCSYWVGWYTSACTWPLEISRSFMPKVKVTARPNKLDVSLTSYAMNKWRTPHSLQTRSRSMSEHVCAYCDFGELGRYGLQISRFYKYMICKDHRQVLDTSKYWFAVIQEF